MNEKKFDFLRDTLLQAGEIVKGGYHAAKEIKHKGVVDLVTQYDVQTEEFIMQKLRGEFPRHTLIGEESDKGIYGQERAIYIDPIDGTTNFIHGIPHLAVSVGIWEGGEAVAAAVYNPILDEFYHALSGGGAYRNGSRIRVSAQDSLQQSLIATGFPYAKVNRGAEYEWVIETIRAILPEIQDIRRLGAAAVDLCYLAEGKTDGFYEIDLKPWDVAAGILILLEAGGKVSDTKGGSYKFGDKGIVASNGQIHEKLLSYMPEI